MTKTIIILILLLMTLGALYARRYFGKQIKKIEQAPKTDPSNGVRSAETNEAIKAVNSGLATREQRLLVAAYQNTRFDPVEDDETVLRRVRAERAYSTLAAAGLALLFLITTAASSFTIVGTKEAGILLTLQKPTGSLTNGFHLKYPWQSVKTMDAAIQTDNHVPNGKTSDGSESLSCITIRIAHQASACVDASIRWQLVEANADVAYQQYRGFNNLRDSLVTRDLNTALAKEMEPYDALAIDDKGVSTAPAFAEIASAVVADMNGQSLGLVKVLSISIPVVRFDSGTQAKIQQIQSQIAATKVAQQAEQTAIAQAAANRALATSVNNSPGVLQAKCLDVVSEAISKGASLPAGFTCLGSASPFAVTANK